LLVRDELIGFVDGAHCGRNKGGDLREMETLISFFVATMACLLAIPVAVLLVEVVASIALPQRNCSLKPSEDGRRIAVLVPAHDESIGLLPTIADIRKQLRAADRLLVVADNCADDTAEVAMAAGAEVVVRNDPDRKGKGYALAFGLGHLGTDPPDIVIMIDSDCRLADRAVDQLAAACALKRRPVQALYLMVAPRESQINHRAAEFAWRIRNWVRPLGLNALGLPCQLMGAGMAFPWDMVSSVDLASESIVEDMKLGLDLALSGHPPLFLPSLGVTSYFPESVEGSRSQRVRWESGHLEMIVAATPRLIFAAVTRRNVDLLAMALDLAVPPLSFLGILTVGMLAIAGLSSLLGFSSVALIVSAATLAGFVCALFISWLKFGRDILPPRAVLLIASYVTGKLPIYGRLFSRKSRPQWIRTDRRKL
jgi:cellulose synthase/poly-beta-1,6-N-acetylglucosamine synthase-like glycosyltransferase